MPDPREIKQFIDFSINNLPVDNAHHQFELLCLELIKQNIMENVIPASGPVARIGDQGRDFLEFKTYLEDNLNENSNFFGDVSSEEMNVFTCSIQKKVLPKIKSDVNKIMEFGLGVNSIFFFCRENIRVGKVNELKKWAQNSHTINLHIFDRNAIADLLARKKNHWIAQRFLNISKAFFESENLSEDLQNFFNRIKVIIERLKNRQFRTDNRMLVSTIGDLNNSNIKSYFGVSISQTRNGFDNVIEFLNGEYALNVSMHISQINFGLFKGPNQINLLNPVAFYEFYSDLQSFVELNTGIKIELPLELVEDIERLDDIITKFHDMVNLIIQLYRTRDYDTFVRLIVNSLKMQEYFGISIRNVNRSNGNITDEYFYFLNRRYYIIPNSTYLRKLNEKGIYDNIITNESHNEEIQIVLLQFFEDIMYYTREKYPNVDINLDGFLIDLN